MIEDDTQLRETTINKLYDVDSKEDMDKILKGIEALPRNKIREIILMGGNYEDVRMETKEAIVKHMSSLPLVSKESAHPQQDNPTYVEANTPIDDKEEVEET